MAEFSSALKIAFFLPSRGTTIITQKENKGEYNGINCGSESCMTSTKWYWQESDSRDIYVHVFDQINSSGTPYRYISATNFSNNVCSGNDIKTTSGNTLYSGTKIENQKSCNPHPYNAGNWYNFPAATAGSNNVSVSSDTEVSNSICPKGWRLPPNSGNKSYNTLIRTAYGLTATNSDSTLLNNSAMAFVRLGNYDYFYGSLSNRDSHGVYQSSTAYSSVNSHHLIFYYGGLLPQYNSNRANAWSIRCVSR